MKMQIPSIGRCLTVFVMALAWNVAMAGPQTTFFNYQGQLQDNGHPANGNYDLAFELYDDASAGNQVGGTLTSPGHAVDGGLFSIGLNFGNTVFNGTQLWLQVYVNTIALSPRTAIRLAPVAEYALTASTVTDGSVTQAKLAGASGSFNAGLSVGAGVCANGTFGVPGAQVGDLAVISWGAGVTPPVGIIFGPASVTAAGTIKANVCNLSASNFSDGSIGVTVQTFR